MKTRFKLGDKVVCHTLRHDAIEDTSTVHTVVRVHGPTAGDSDGQNEYIQLEAFQKSHPLHNFKADRYRAAINGKDYPATCAPAPAPNDLYPSGHLADGSSVQKHSAGELYPYVAAYRDSTDPHSKRKYDVGLIGPRVVGTAWFTSFEDAVAAAVALKK